MREPPSIGPALGKLPATGPVQCGQTQILVDALCAASGRTKISIGSSSKGENLRATQKTLAWS